VKKTAYHIYACGDSALTIELSNVMDELINEQILSLFHCLQKQKNKFIKDIIPAYSSLTVIYYVIEIKKHHDNAFIFIRDWIENILAKQYLQVTIDHRLITIPVCYDTSLALDIIELAAQKNISVQELIHLHTQKKYRVYMIGFLPGFAYMGKVDERIAAPRKSTPRTNIIAGSVGIAGEQTGIYPLDSPGGWNIIGRTPLKMFDATKEQPTFLQAGDEVEFVSISLEEFNQQLL
jgi:inhibitor of KinA